MTSETQVRDALRRSVAVLPSGDREGAEPIMRKGRRRRRLRRSVVALVVVALLYPLAWVPALVTRQLVADGGVTEVAVAMIPVSVSGRDGTSGIWIGAPGPTPRFDTSELGPDLSLARGEPDRQDFEGPVPADTVVYLGDLGDEPIYIYSRPPPSVWDLVSEYLFGNWSGKIYGTSLSCCSSNADVPEQGLPGVSGWMAGKESGGVGEWLALPREAAVVAYEVDGEPLGWQRPVGRAVMTVIDFEQRAELSMTVYDSSGAVLMEFDPSDGLSGTAPAISEPDPGGG